jgi:anaerobic selenocysteine-containing dehydrogenase
MPYEGNLATPEGPCIKGLSYLEREFSDERIIYPLKKRDDGSFEKIDIYDALELIAGKLNHVRNTNGSHAVLFYKGSGMSGLSNDISSLFWRLYGGVTTTYGNLCWPAGLEAVRLTLGEVKHNAPWDLANADLIILWGKNPAETNVQELIHIDKALKKGARLVVIDPRRTPTADKADLLLRPHPGTDAALALAIAGYLVRHGHINSDFISKHVMGYDEFAKSLTITPEEAYSVTGIPAEAIIKFAGMIASSARVTMVPGYGLQRHSNGGQTIRALLSIMVITGNIGKAGCGFNFANLQSYIFDSEKEPVTYYPDAVRDNPFRRNISMAKFADDISVLKDPEIKLAWIERGNPATQLPDSERVITALNAVDFKVVVEQFMTDTARLADIILPAKGLFEQPDVVGSYWNPYVQYKPAIIEYPGQVIPESEIYYRLSRLLKLCSDEENPIPSPGNDNFDRWLEGRIKEKGEVTLEHLKKGPYLPSCFAEVVFTDLNFPTPSGKIELISKQASAMWSVPELPTYMPLKTGTDKQGMLHLLTPNTGSRIHSQFGNLKTIRSVVEPPMWELSPVDAEKLNLTDGNKIRISNGNGSVTGSVRITNRVKQGCIVFPNGVWAHEGGGVNALIPGRETDMGYGAAFHDSFVKVEKIKE